jgi:hypothetical protein
VHEIEEAPALLIARYVAQELGLSAPEGARDMFPPRR